MAKTRSPNYPAISLAEAIDKIKKIYKAEHMHPASDEVIARTLNYTGLNGRSMGVISAIKKYGLLVPEGDGHRVSDDAVNIIELPPEDPEHIKAVEKAAFMPQLFSELHETYGDQLPSDSNLRHFLIKKKFNPNAANEVIKLYRDTLELVTAQTPEYNAEEAKDEPKSPIGTSMPSIQKPPAQVIQPQGIPSGETFGAPSVVTPEGLSFKISENSINVAFNGMVTQETIQKLIKYLEISKDDYPTKKELEKPKEKVEAPRLC